MTGPATEESLPAEVVALYSAAGELIRRQVLAGLAWPELVEAVEHRLADYGVALTVYAGVLPCLACGAVGGRSRDALPLASAWILNELAADIFDDIQDQDGKPRPWNEWPPAMAMNVALGLLGGAQACLALLQSDGQTMGAILATWSRTILLAAQAQATPPGADGDAQRLLENYFRHIAAKSGGLYAAVAWAGGRLATEEPAHLEALRSYGMALGMMVQLVDDGRDHIGLFGHPNISQLSIFIGGKLISSASCHTISDDYGSGSMTQTILSNTPQTEATQFQKAEPTSDSEAFHCVEAFVPHIQNLALLELEALKVSCARRKLEVYVRDILVRP